MKIRVISARAWEKCSLSSQLPLCPSLEATASTVVTGAAPRVLLGVQAAVLSGTLCSRRGVRIRPLHLPLGVDYLCGPFLCIFLTSYQICVTLASCILTTDFGVLVTEAFPQTSKVMQVIYVICRNTRKCQQKEHTVTCQCPQQITPLIWLIPWRLCKRTPAGM